jgi:SAM-dependent methyltransferase
VTITTRGVDLEAPDLARPEPRFDLIVVVRYLHRPLFPWIEAALAPGGHLLIETFLRGQERFGHPRRDRFLLERGELRTVWRTLEVLEIEETSDAQPPVLARLHARRPAED